MHIHRWFESLRTRLIVLVFLAVIPAWTVVLHLAHEQREKAAANARRDIMQIATQVSHQHELILEATRNLLMTVAQSPALTAGDTAAAEQLFRTLMENFPRYGNIGLIATNGQVVASAVPTTEPLSLWDRGYFQAALHSKQFAIGDYMLGRIIQRPVLALAYPVLDSRGEVQSVVYASLSISWLGDSLGVMELPLDYTVTVADRNGTILARRPGGEDAVGLSLSSQITQLVAAASSATAAEVELAGRRNYAAVVPLQMGTPEGRVHAIVTIPESRVIGPINRSHATYMVLLTLAGLAALVLTWYAAKTLILNPAETLKHAVLRLAEGDLGIRTGLRHSQGEIGSLAEAFDEMAKSLERKNAQITLAYEETLDGWSRALDIRDHQTEGHTERVTDVTVEFARAMGFSEEQLVHVRRGAQLHDIGKMGVPDSILLKPHGLDDEEWNVMRKHPIHAYHLLSPIDYLRPALEIPYCHHERWNGSGYPRGLRGDAIPLAARIFSVVDVWDALRHDRPYRRAWPESQVIRFIQAGASNLFDPDVVRTFMNLHDHFVEMIDSLENSEVLQKA